MARQTELGDRSGGEAEAFEVGAPWAAVLAGGEGVRLRPLVRRVWGDERPKQFVPLLGPRTLLGQTLDRIGVTIPPERTVVVGLEGHEGYLAREFAERPAPHLLRQPTDRGTAAAVLFAAEWIAAQDPDATVAFFPSDHFVLEEGEFMERVAEVARFVERQPEWMTLLGAEPTEPETEYGWIEPDEAVGTAGDGAVYRNRRFREKPTREVAERLFAKGCLWNTFVLVARASVVLAAGRECVPSMADRLARLSSFWGTGRERWAIRQAYALAPAANFSRSILEACSQPLAVVKMRGVTWSDLGSPGRVAKTMARFGIAAPWDAEAIA